jgi:predicted MFS family arabinose efflux permease
MVCCTCIALPTVVLGSMIAPLSSLYGWSRASITSSVLFTALGTLIFAPVTGLVVDRIGARRVGLVGLTALGAAMCGIALSGPSIASWFLAWIVFAVVQPAAGFVVWANGVTSRFRRHLGLALGIMFTGTSVLVALLPPVSVAITQHFGWRAVYFALAGFVLFVALPLAAKFFVPLSAPCADGITGQPAGVEKEGRTLHEALGSRHFWQLTLGSLVASGGIAVIFIHLQSMLTDAGGTATSAAAVLAVVGPASLIGRICSGYLVDRLPANLVAGAFLLCPAIGFVLLMNFDGSHARALVIAVLSGMAQGAESDLLAYLTRQYFGKRAFSTLYGFVLGGYSVGFGFAPVLAGLVFDRTHSYEPVIVPLAMACVVGSALIAMLGRSQYGVRPAR